MPNAPKSNQVKGALLTLAGGICWGLSGTMGQYLFTRQGMDSRWLVPIRLGLAGLLMLAYYLVRRPALLLAPWRGKRNVRDMLIYGILGVSCCQFLYFLTIQLSSAGIATILQDLSPVMVMAVVCFTAKRLPRPYEIVSIVLALGGVFLITTHGDLSSFAVSPLALAVGSLSAVCVTIYNVWPKNLMRQFPVPLMQGWAFLLGGALFTLLFRPWRFGYLPNIVGIFGILFVVLVGNVLAFTCFMTGVKLIGPERGVLYGFSEPVTAALIATLFLGSSFTFWDAVGFACVFAMLVLLSIGPRLQAKEEPGATH